MTRLTTRIGAIGLALASALLAFPAAPATALTATEQGRHYENREVNPCTGDAGTATNTANEVLHLHTDGAERDHFSFTSTGTITFVPDDPDRESFSGRFTARAGGMFVDDEPRVFGFSVTANLTGSAGTELRFHFLQHVTVGPSGFHSEVTKLDCR